MSPIVDNFFSKKSPYGYIILAAAVGIFGTLFYPKTNKHAQTTIFEAPIFQAPTFQAPVSQVNKEDSYRETLGKRSGRRHGGKKMRNKTKKRK